jgi:YebC/PmpR family DNA-binding regulatory protein
MAGHSKWANIKHRKGAQDAKRGKIFTKLIREITVAARMGGGVPHDNPRLRAVLDKALTANMTRDTIDRAIKRGVGGDDGADLDEIRYEGYGPNGVAIMIDCMTNNRNRTVGEVRHILSKCGGNLGADGSVGYLFTKKGEFLFGPQISEDQLMEVAIDLGVDDIIVNEDQSKELYCNPAQYEAVQAALRAKELIPERSELAYIPSTYATVSGEAAEKMLKLIDLLEDLDDVQEVYHNAQFEDA